MSKSVERPYTLHSMADTAPAPKLSMARSAWMTLRSVRGSPGEEVAGARTDGRLVGSLNRGEFRVELDDGELLGLVAYVLDVATVHVELASRPGRFYALSAWGESLPRELGALLDQLERGDVSLTEAKFVRDLGRALRLCRQSEGLSLSELESWQSKLQMATEFVPLPYRRNITLSRGAYDEAGRPLGDPQAVSKAQYLDMLAELRQAFEEGVGAAGLQPWNLVVVGRVEPWAPIGLNGPSRQALMRMLYPLGFTRIPANWAELERAVAFCTLLQRCRDFVAKTGRGPARGAALAASLALALEQLPDQVVLFKKALHGNFDELKELHRRKDWLESLATSYSEQGDLLMSR